MKALGLYFTLREMGTSWPPRKPLCPLRGSSFGVAKAPLQGCIHLPWTPEAIPLGSDSREKQPLGISNMPSASLICKRSQHFSEDVGEITGLRACTPPAARLLPALPVTDSVTLSKVLNTYLCLGIMVLCNLRAVLRIK